MAETTISDVLNTLSEPGCWTLTAVTDSTNRKTFCHNTCGLPSAATLWRVLPSDRKSSSSRPLRN